MKNPFLIISVTLLILIFISGNATAETNSNGNNKDNIVNFSLSSGDLILEIEGLDNALTTAADSMQGISSTLKKMSDKDEFSEEDRALFREAVKTTNETAKAILKATNDLPNKVKESQKPLTKIGQNIKSEILLVVTYFLVGLGLLILFSGIIIYRSIIKPTYILVDNISKIGVSVENTVESAVKFETQQKILLDKYQKLLEKDTNLIK